MDDPRRQPPGARAVSAQVVGTVARPADEAAPRAAAPPWSRLQRWTLIAIALVGVVGRVAYVDRPLDHRLLASWREADYTQLARNFYRDELNIFYPQIDWRGDTPGYAEMEFPIVPWTAAVLDRLFGYREAWLRVPASIAAVLALLLFLRLCRQVLPPGGALFAAAAFAVNPLLIYLATAMQPESLMLLLSILAMTLIWRWDERPEPATLFAAALTVALGILAKSPAAYLGLVLAYVVIRKRGWQAFSDVSIYAAALLAIVPPLAWYAWAAHFWTMYGNSLGVSNESHFIGWDILFPPRFLRGILKWETIRVFTPAGWLLALAALSIRRGRAALALVWYGAVWVFYVAIARTSGDDWSFYYHSSSVAPACLLMGAGLVALTTGRDPSGAAAPPVRWRRWAGGVLAAATLALLVRATVQTIDERDTNPGFQEMRRCVLQFQPYVPPSALIVVRGGPMFDEDGHPVAYNESMAFAWMDRKGFNYGKEELGLSTLQRIAARGGRFWIARRDELERNDLGRLVDARYARVATCDDSYFLYDLRRS
jgi:4-amino-4-deoxy-L-arabinose transferase-like glycosyltransferase